MSAMSIKQVALEKKNFLTSPFGKYVAGELTRIHGNLHERAENAQGRDEKLTYIDQAAGVSRVIAFFVNDVRILDSGYNFDPEEKKKKEAEPDA